ncbi:MAG: bifunctional hydroxymethylpyrimidine kinase/phosphomethylpyrimidine kinase [Candidatus Promineifilaceae bacterium]|jgi:hydroxymethylpyrimidine/phosphomethylpyrimidine kinase
MSTGSQPLKVLTIGGSDSGGAAGIQADLKTCAVLDVYGMSVLTVATAQNSQEVAGAHYLPPKFIGEQLDAVLKDYGADAVKTGFIGRADAIIAITQKIVEYGAPSPVVDPILVNHKGEAMFTDSVAEAYLEHLLPNAVLATPNVWEAELLSRVRITNRQSMEEACRALIAAGCQHVLITGRISGGEVIDLFHDGKSATEYRSTTIDTMNRHGSGDILSAAICVFLARGFTIFDAIGEARSFTRSALQSAREWRMGAGHGPVDHRGNRKTIRRPNS